MGVMPAFYLADFSTGDLGNIELPLENVSLSSSLRPGSFTADLDMRKACSTMREARDLLDLLRDGKTTLAPIQENLFVAEGQPRSARVLGEWWITDIEATHSDPVVRLSGPEFAGYAQHVQLNRSWIGNLDPVRTAREMLTSLFTTSQSVQFDPQEWVSQTGVTVDVDARASSGSYWDAIRDLQGEHFEWMIRAGQELETQSSGSVAVDIPVRVTRTLQIGQPVVAYPRPYLVMEVKAAGTPGTLLDMSQSWSESRSATTMHGFGAGSGKDQISATASRSRAPGEPVKSRVVTARDVMSESQLALVTRRAMNRMQAAEQVFTGVQDRYRPVVGEVVHLIQEPSWSMPRAVDKRVRCVGWSWSSKDANETYSPWRMEFTDYA